MANVITSDQTLARTVAPRLPTAPTDYDRVFAEQHNNALRLYFNQLDNILGQLSADSAVIPPTTVFTVATLPSAATSGAGLGLLCPTPRGLRLGLPLRVVGL
jgi:hypothetical protein